MPQTFTLDTRPALAGAAAEQAIIAAAGGSGTLLRRIELTILPMAGGEPRLAYQTVVSRSGSVFRLFIDANTGAELLRFSEIQTQSAVGTGRGLVGDTKKMSTRPLAGAFVADDRLRPPSLLTYDMRNNFNRLLLVLDGLVPLTSADLATDTDNTWTDIPAVDGHAYIGWTYDYYFKRHGRRSLDNRDRPIVTLINGVSQQGSLNLSLDDFFTFAVNAFFCGQCGPGNIGVMFFGNGFPSNFVLDGQNWTYLAGSLDVAAHELTHGVTDSSSGLIYQNESGALNEAFSDIMATSAEFYFQPVGAGIGQADFLIGEDSIRAPGGVRPRGHTLDDQPHRVRGSRSLQRSLYGHRRQRRCPHQLRHPESRLLPGRGRRHQSRVASHSDRRRDRQHGADGEGVLSSVHVPHAGQLHLRDSARGDDSGRAGSLPCHRVGGERGNASLDRRRRELRS